MPFFETIRTLDKALFESINETLSSPLADPVMILIRNPLTWIPLYVFLAVWTIRKWKQKAWVFILCTAICVGLTDFLAASVIKPLVGRLRPCIEPTLIHIVRIVDGCG